MDSDERQALLDEERLRWLGLFHYVFGGTTIAFSSLFIVHVVFMGVISTNPGFMNIEGMPEESRAGFETMRIFVWLLGALICLGITYGILELVSGYFIRNKKRRLLSLIVAIPRIIFLPYGTVLSILTLLLLEQDSVKARYARHDAMQ